MYKKKEKCSQNLVSHVNHMHMHRRDRKKKEKRKKEKTTMQMQKMQRPSVPNERVYFSFVVYLQRLYAYYGK